jgi:hypothetical protein
MTAEERTPVYYMFKDAQTGRLYYYNPENENATFEKPTSGVIVDGDATTGDVLTDSEKDASSGKS